VGLALAPQPSLQDLSRQSSPAEAEGQSKRQDQAAERDGEGQRDHVAPDSTREIARPSRRSVTGTGEPRSGSTLSIVTNTATATVRAGTATASAREPGSVQFAVVGTAGALLGAGFAWLAVHYGPRQGALLLVGAACGLVLYHAAFGFTGAFRALVTIGDGRGLQAQMLMLAVATVLFAPILAAGEVFGTPVAGAVAPAGVAVLAGAFVFAIGMQLGGGCGSGTLYHLGSGATPMILTLSGFIAGSVIATFHMPFWWATPSVGEITLGDMLGWPAAVGVQLGACALIAGLAWWIGRRRLGPMSAPHRPGPAWRRLVSGPWSLAAGAVDLALLNVLTLVLAGHPWGITWAFALWGAKALRLAGWDLSDVAFWSGEYQQAALAAPVLADITSAMDIGIMLGAALAAGLAGRFRPAGRIRPRLAVAAVLGGLLLGYGARVAYGCNIGAYVGGIASTSLHGWLWGAAALLGTPIGVRLRRLFGVDERRPAR
jgi:uncharacterized membrane protein YedE/YeeE